MSATVVFGQYLETTIFVPDSFGSLYEPRLVTCNPANGQVYVSGYRGNIMVLDGATGEKVGAVPVDTCLAVLCDSAENTLYAVACKSEKVFAIDGSTNQVVAEMAVGHGPSRLCINRDEDKLYCANQGTYYEHDSTVTVIDLSTNTVITNVKVGEGPIDVCWSQSVNKVYCSVSGDTTIRVLEGAGDSVIGTIDLERSATRLFCVPGGERVYAMERFGIDVVDVHGDTVMDRIEALSAFEYCLAPDAGKLYVGGYDGVDVIDITADSLLRQLDSLSDVFAFCYLPVRNCVYAAQSCLYGGIAVIDVNSDSIVDTVPARVVDGSMCCDRTQDRVYATGVEAGKVSVIDCSADTLLPPVSTRTSLQAMGYVGRTDRLYCSEAESKRVFVHDGSDYRRRAVLELPRAALGFCHDPGRRRVLVHLWGGDSIAAIDETGDSLVGWIESGFPVYDLHIDTANRLLYAVGSDPDYEVAIIDADRDSVIAQFEVCGGIYDGTPVPQQNKLFGLDDYEDYVVVVSGELRRLTTRIPLGDDAWDICANSVGTRVYAAVGDDSVVAVIDAVHNRLLRRVHADGEPRYVCHDPSTDRVFCSCRSPGEVVALDAEADSIIARIPVGSYPGGMLYCPGVRQAYCMDRTDRSVTAIDADECEALAVVGLSSVPRGLACSADESRVYVLTYQGMSVVRTATGIAEQDVATGNRTGHRRPSVVRGVLYIQPTASGSEPRACLLDVSGRKVMDLQPGENDIHHLAPGVYFVVTPSPFPSPPEGERMKERGVRSAVSAGRSPVRKVIIQR